MSTEGQMPYEVGGDQYKWLESDLAAARARNVTWLVLTGEFRPFHPV